MKFTPAFALLAVFAAKSLVSAAPTLGADDALLEARAEFIEGALEEVWSRFYDELLEEVEARDFMDDEDLFERAPMKKFATDVATNLAQKAPQMAQQYSQSQQAKNRNQQPRLANIVQQAQQQKQGGSSSRPSVPKIPTGSKWNTVKKPSVLDEIKKLKKRSLDDIEEDLFVRMPMKKFATDVATNLAQKAPQMAQQYSQSQQAKNRNQQPRLANVVQQAQQQKQGGSSSRPSVPKIPAGSKWNTVKKPSVLDEVKKLGKK